jgi:geranylgeranyl diphosphate synthase type I
MATVEAWTAAGFTHNGLRGRIDNALAEFLDEGLAAVEEIACRSAFELVRSYVLGGGKRIRPTFCYWGWRGAGGADCDEIVRAAAALELFHAFALIHDDIMDGSDTRRGRPSMHRQLAALHADADWHGRSEAFGIAAAILVGDLCMIWADELLHRSGLDLVRVRAAQPVYSRMRSEVICGQYLDVAETARRAFSVPRSMRVIRYKAAKYSVEHPLRLGGVLAAGGPDLLASYTAFGLPLGEAFQLRDDMIGVFGEPAVTGKSTLDDLREGKPTVLMAYAADHATPAQLAVIRRLHGNRQLDSAGAAQLRAILHATGAVTAVEEMIKVRAQDALTALRVAPITDEARPALTELTHAALWRDT